MAKYPCISEDCNSSDGVEIYQDEDGSYNATCFVCESYFNNNQLARSDLGKELGIEAIESKKHKIKRRSEKNNVSKKKEKAVITDEQRKEIQENAGFKGKNYRGIKDKYNRMYQVRTEFDEETGEVCARYYPVTEGYVDCKVNLTGYKKRIVPEKDFRSIGRVGKISDFFGQWLCKGKGKIVICGGECDAISAKQMYAENKKSTWADVDFISGTLGESACADQAKIHYDFLDMYDSIIVNLDNDDAGFKAEKQLLEVLPIHKTKIMRIPLKDASDMLQTGRDKEYIRCFFDAKKVKLSGISDSNSIIESMKTSAIEERIGLPDFLSSVNRALGGGYGKRSFNILAAQTSVGKTLISNSIVHHFISENRKVGLISLEASAGYVGEQLASIHLGIKLNDIEDVHEKLSIIEEHQNELEKLFNDEYGNSNLYILDDRSLLDDLDSIFNNMQKLIRGCGVEILLIDVASDLIDTFSLEQQNEFMGRIKKLIAAQPVCIIGVFHMRKGDDKNPHDIGEFSIYGSSAAIKSSYTTLLFSRDKLADSEEEKNSTRVLLSKNRNTGRTGRMNDIFYCSKTGKLTEKIKERVDF